MSTMENPVIGREYPSNDEHEIVNEMIRLTKIQMERNYANSKALRQVHAKMHGCVNAEFIIEGNLPPELRVGVFKEAICYDALVRYSNGVSGVKHDKKPDTRGCAIKLLYVTGEKLLDTESDMSQDFVLAASPFFFAGNLKSFMGLLKASIAKTPLPHVLFFFATNWKIAFRTLTKILIKIRNPFEIPYFSGTPYRFGDETKAVKYHLRPSPQNKMAYTDKSDFNFLRKTMEATLKLNDLYFDFCIQFQTDAVKMPIEDASVEWKSPFIKLATLKIPMQDFNNAEMDALGEEMTFNIWHTLPEHKPLGGFNRGRRFIYEALYKVRKEMNTLKEKGAEIAADF